MYVPEEFRAVDDAVVRDVVRAYPFATLVTSRGAEPVATHLPLLFTEASPPILRGHLARKNPQAADVDARGQVLAIFHGPHGYVSPGSYSHHPSVPTWNYVAVHAYGIVRPMSDSELTRLLEESVAHFEAGATPAQCEASPPWKLEVPEKYLSGMKSQILGFAIEVTRFEAKLKLSQNKSEEDQRRVIARFDRGSPDDQSVAAFMRRVLDI
jgi:transcriptional regulator